VTALSPARLFNPHGMGCSRRQRLIFGKSFRRLSMQALGGRCLEEPVSKENSRLERSERRRSFTTFRNHKPVYRWLTAERAKSKNMITRPRQRLWVRRETAAMRIAPSTKPTMLIAEKINIL
jgi:hypothetical protein